MKPLILFDIDHTLFDTDIFSNSYRKKFLSFLNITEDNLDKIRSKYKASLSKHTDYNPKDFIKHVINSLHLSKQPKIYEKLNGLLFDTANFSRSLFSDTRSSLSSLHQFYQIGIFSEGHQSFQKSKLAKSGLYDLFSREHIFIFRRKTDPASLGKIPAGSTIVDDDESVITDLLAQNIIKIFPVWINRKDAKKHPHTRTIYSLSELI